MCTVLTTCSVCYVLCTLYTVLVLCTMFLSLFIHRSLIQLFVFMLDFLSFWLFAAGFVHLVSLLAAVFLRATESVSLTHV